MKLKLSERDMQIVKSALVPYMKKIVKLAQVERNSLGLNGSFDELEEYTKELIFRLDMELNLPENIKLLEDRTKRIKAIK